MNSGFSSRESVVESHRVVLLIQGVGSPLTGFRRARTRIPQAKEHTTGPLKPPDPSLCESSHLAPKITLNLLRASAGNGGTNTPSSLLDDRLVSPPRLAPRTSPPPPRLEPTARVLKQPLTGTSLGRRPRDRWRDAETAPKRHLRPQTREPTAGAHRGG